MLCYSVMQTRYMPLLHLCDGNSTGCCTPSNSVGDFIPLSSCQKGGSGFSFGLEGISCRSHGNMLARERGTLLAFPSVSLSTRLFRRKHIRQVTSIPSAKRQPAMPTPRPIFVTFERPPGVGSLVEFGESVGPKVDGVVDCVVDGVVVSGDVPGVVDMPSVGEALGGVDVLFGNVVGGVEDSDEVDFEEVGCEDEIACPTTAAILIPVPSLQQLLFPPPQHQEPSLHSVTATFCAAALPSTPAS